MPIVVSGSCVGPIEVTVTRTSSGSTERSRIALDGVDEVARRAALAALRRRVQHEVDRVRRLEDLERQQVLDLLQHRDAVDLELGPHVVLADLVREALDVVAVVGEEDLLAADEEVEQAHVERAHLRREPDGRDPLLDRQPRPAAGRQLHDRVGLRAQPLVQLAVDLRVHRVRPVRVARVDVQDRCSRTPRVDALRDDLVRLLGQRIVGLLAVDAARQRAGDDDRLCGRLPAHAPTVSRSSAGLRTKRSLRSASAEVGWPMKSALYVSGEKYAAITETEHMTVK